MQGWKISPPVSTHTHTHTHNVNIHVNLHIWQICAERLTSRKKSTEITWKVGLILRMVWISFHSLAKKYVLQMLTVGAAVFPSPHPENMYTYIPLLLCHLSCSFYFAEILKANKAHLLNKRLQRSDIGHGYIKKCLLKKRRELRHKTTLHYKTDYENYRPQIYWTCHFEVSPNL